MVSNEDIMRCLEYCSKCFRHNGVNVSIPEHTDITKTYKWRYVKKFLKTAKEWDIENEMMFKLVDKAIKIAIKKKLLYKGFGLLNSNSLLEQACDELVKDEGKWDKMIKRIKADKERTEHVDLSYRDSPDGLCKLTTMYMSGEMSKTFIAISRKCNLILKKLKKHERGLLPSGTELLLIINDINSDNKIRPKFRKIMGSDWRSMRC